MNNKSVNILNSKGFAIPQILLLGVGIAVALSGILYTTIISLTGTRLNKQELLSKSASESGITNIRNLLNDSGDSYFHYFWLSDSCSASSESCPTGLNIGSKTIPDPTKEYWTDELWCQDIENCRGRQKAPMCTIASSSEDPSPLDWESFKSIFGQLIDSSLDKIGDDIIESRRDFIQYFDTQSTEYIGTEKYGVNSIVINGIVKDKSKNIKTGFNKLRANIQINHDTPKRGFGFLSAGEKEMDGKKSLYLGNLNIISEEGDAIGSIIWRRNILDKNECLEIIDQARANKSFLPSSGNGGLWVQPIGLPKQPRLSNVQDLGGALICTPLNLKKFPTTCKLPNSSEASNYRITAIYASSPNSIFEVSTSDSKPITLEILGDIDISNNGIFCHLEEGSNICGSGNPKNLTILFKQETKTNINKIYCNSDENSNGGVSLTEKEIIDLSTLDFDNNALPGSSISIENTGFSLFENFGGFVYGPKTTFISTQANSPWVQLINDDITKEKIRAPMIVSHRGTYGWILDSSGSRNQDKMSNLILSNEGFLIPYLNFIEDGTRLEIVGIGYDEEYQDSSTSLEPKTGKFLIYNVENENYYLRSFQIIDNLNEPNKRNVLGFFPWAAAKLESDLTFLSDADNLNQGDSKILLDRYNILIESRKENIIKRFKGAAWVKNICLDNFSNQTWEFNKEFIDGIKRRYGTEFNFGIKFYRGRSIILWDTLRDFES